MCVGHLICEFVAREQLTFIFHDNASMLTVTLVHVMLDLRKHPVKEFPLGAPLLFCINTPVPLHKQLVLENVDVVDQEDHTAAHLLMVPLQVGIVLNNLFHAALSLL